MFVIISAASITFISFSILLSLNVSIPFLRSCDPFGFGRESGSFDVVLETDGNFDYPGSFCTFGAFGKFGRSGNFAGFGSVGFGAVGFGAVGFGAVGFGAVGFGVVTFGGFGTGTFTAGTLGGTFGTLISLIFIIIAKAAAMNCVSVWARTRLESDSSVPYSMSSSPSWSRLSVSIYCMSGMSAAWARTAVAMRIKIFLMLFFVFWL